MKLTELTLLNRMSRRKSLPKNIGKKYTKCLIYITAQTNVFLLQLTVQALLIFPGLEKRMFYFFQLVGESGLGGGVEDRMGKKELLFLVKMLTLKWIKYCWEK